MAEKVVKSLSEDFLHCTICTEPYNEPKMLPCLHSFCLQCLERWVSNRHGQPFSCPTCRCNVGLPSNGMSGLPHNFFLVSLMERLKEISKLSKENQDYNCSICKNKNDMIFCLDCKMHICQGCQEIHNRFTRSSDHPLVPSEKLTDENYLQRVLSTQPPYCNQHKQEKVRYYCTQCAQLACQVCAIVSHQGHKSLHEVESIVSSVKAQLETLLEESESNTRDARYNLEVTKEATDEIELQISQLLSKVDARYDKIVMKLQSDKAKLTEQLQRIKDKLCSPITMTERKISDWLKAMENTQEMTRKILQQNNPWDILEMKSNIFDSLERLKADKEKKGTLEAEVHFVFQEAKLLVSDKYKSQKETCENLIGTLVPESGFSLYLFSSHLKLK